MPKRGENIYKRKVGYDMKHKLHKKLVALQ